jgi:hypothetical protein
MPGFQSLKGQSKVSIRIKTPRACSLQGMEKIGDDCSATAATTFGLEASHSADLQHVCDVWIAAADGTYYTYRGR